MRPTPTAGRRLLAPTTLLFEPSPDLGDVTEATAPGRLVEAELHRHHGLGEQRQLLGLGGRFDHAFIMKRGCHNEDTEGPA